ncbi:MAG: hypothetical protein OHK0017_01190 [Patescibacteria group bacterium]
MSNIRTMNQIKSAEKESRYEKLKRLAKQGEAFYVSRGQEKKDDIKTNPVLVLASLHGSPVPTYYEGLVVARQISIGNDVYLGINDREPGFQKLVIQTAERNKELLEELFTDSQEQALIGNFHSENNVDEFLAKNPDSKTTQYLPSDCADREYLRAKGCQELDDVKLFSELDKVSTFGWLSSVLRNKQDLEILEKVSQKVKQRTGYTDSEIQEVIRKAKSLIVRTDIIKPSNIIELLNQAINEDFVLLKKNGASGTGVESASRKECNKLSEVQKNIIIDSILHLYEALINGTLSQPHNFNLYHKLYILLQDWKIDTTALKFDILERVSATGNNTLAAFAIFNMFAVKHRYESWAKFKKDLEQGLLIMQKGVANAVEGSYNLARVEQESGLPEYVMTAISEQLVVNNSHAGNQRIIKEFDSETVDTNDAIQLCLELMLEKINQDNRINNPEKEYEIDNIKLPYMGWDFLENKDGVQLIELNARETGMAMFYKKYVNIVLKLHPKLIDKQFFGCNLKLNDDPSSINNPKSVKILIQKAKQFNQKHPDLVFVPTSIFAFPPEAKDKQGTYAIGIFVPKKNNLTIKQILELRNQFDWSF